MPSLTTTRASKARTPIPMCWVKSSAFVCRWVSRRSLRHRENMDRKISMKVSIICGSKKSGIVFTTPARRHSRRRATGSWPLTSNVAPPATISLRSAVGFQNDGGWICRSVPWARSFTCGGRMTRERSGCWVIVGWWTNSGSTGWCAPRWTWRPIKSAATGCAVARPRSSPWLKLSNMYFQKNIFIPPDPHQMAHRFSHFP